MWLPPKRLFSNLITHGLADSLSLCRQLAAADAAGGVAGNAGISFLNLGSLSSELQAQNPALVSSMLLNNSLRAAAPGSSDLGSFLFSNVDSLPSGTPPGSVAAGSVAGSVELAA